MIRRVKRLLKRSVRACVRVVRPVARDRDEVERHLDSLIREVTRLHTRMEILEELIRQTHTGAASPGEESAQYFEPPDAAALRKRAS
jgi:hypothetical protein